MKVLVVSQYYPPENVPIPAAVARGLRERGHRVRVLTGFPNYPEGKVFPGYRQRWRDLGTQDGIDVCRVPLYADHSGNPVARMINYLSFALSSATARRHSRGADVVYVYATQMTAAMGPWLWRATRGRPYVLHVQDLWPDSIVGSSLVGGSRAGRAIGALLKPWLASVYRRASAVVAIAPTMAETLRGRGVDPDKIHVVHNWADDHVGARSADASAAPAQASGTTTFLYAGNVGDMQDLETVVRAVDKLRDEPVRLRIVGDGVALDRVRATVEELGAEHVHLDGRVPSEQMPAIYADADYALITLRDLPVFHGTIPSKLQAALASATPVVTTVPGDARRIVEAGGVGFTAAGEDVDSLERALRRAHETTAAQRAELSRRSRQLYDEKFSSDAGLDSLESILMTATGKDAHRR